MALGRITITVDVSTLVQDHELDDDELATAMREVADIAEVAIENALGIYQLEGTVDYSAEEVE